MMADDQSWGREPYDYHEEKMEEPRKKPSIVLAMIVKDEAHVIERCLESVRPYIDTLMIHDTGSSDDTIERINNFCARYHIPGMVSSREWVNFGHNRSLVLASARNKADYTLMLDADETFGGNYEDILQELYSIDKDLYSMKVYLGDCQFTRNFLFKNDRPWVYKDPVHEYAYTENSFLPGDIVSGYIMSHHDGARSKDPEKYKKDAQMLLEIPSSERTPRQTFYLAQCFKDSGDLDNAVRMYKRRVDMETGWWQERYYSFYMIGRLTKDCKALLEAFLLEPLRAEPLVVMGKILMDQQNWYAASMPLLHALSLINKNGEPPEGSLFVEKDVYEWRAKMELAVCLYYLGSYRKAYAFNRNLLNKALPPHVREQVQKNREFCEAKIPEEEG